MTSLITGTDSYKFSHFYQDPPEVKFKMSHVIARADKVGSTNGVIFFGLQAWIKERLSKPITIDDVNDARKFAAAHGVPFNDVGWDIILREHSGYLPVAIWAVPEGTFVPVGVAQAVVVNTDKRLPWLVSYIETEMLRAIWYPSTVATVSAKCREIIYDSLITSSDDPDGQIDFKLHDFGQRGVSSRESAGLGGMAHLLNFKGTDTTEGVYAAMRYYNADVCGFSIPAMEHSTVTVWGQENEGLAFENMINKSPSPIVACVSDSYDIYNACANIWGDQLKQKVIDSGKVIVIRPDSGNPHVVLPRMLTILGDKFGYTVNRKGFGILNNVRIIWGDGINHKSLPVIIETVMDYGWSIDNIAFGMGSGLLQQVNRDTFGYAMKCNAARKDLNDSMGPWFGVSKNPITDSSKRSWDGPIDVILSGGKLENMECNPGSHQNTALELVYENGSIGRIQTFDQVKAQIKR